MSSEEKAVELLSPQVAGIHGHDWLPTRRMAHVAAAHPSSGKCLWVQCLCQQEMPPWGENIDMIRLLVFLFSKLRTLAKKH